MKSNGNKIIIVVLVLIIIGLGVFSIYDEFIFKPVNKTIENSSNEISKKNNVTTSKVNELNINGRLVQNLYEMVVDGGIESTSYLKYWMYGDNDNFKLSEADTKTKMFFVGINLDEKHSFFDNSCTNIPDKVDTNFTSLCKINKEDGNNYELQSYFSKEYVESMYKKIYGDNAILDTSVLISTNSTTRYSYVSSYNKYYKYVLLGGGTGSSFKSNITKATIKNDTVKIYEDVTIIDDLTNSTSKYIYTFKLDNKDNMYNFISRIKQN